MNKQLKLQKLKSSIGESSFNIWLQLVVFLWNWQSKLEKCKQGTYNRFYNIFGINTLIYALRSQKLRQVNVLQSQSAEYPG